MPSVGVVTWSLEMTDPGALRPRRARRPGLALVRAERPAPAFGRFLYETVGGPWHWSDRRAWSERDWRRWLGRPEVETWVLHERGTPAGYFELERQPDASTEIVYLGLLPGAEGHGLGGHLLTLAAERAWAPPTRRVWVHTCTLDHPAALPNYLARGFRVFREDRHLREVADAAR